MLCFDLLHAEKREVLTASGSQQRDLTLWYPAAINRDVNSTKGRQTTRDGFVHAGQNYSKSYRIKKLWPISLRSRVWKMAYCLSVSVHWSILAVDVHCWVSRQINSLERIFIALRATVVPVTLILHVFDVVCFIKHKKQGVFILHFVIPPPP